MSGLSQETGLQRLSLEFETEMKTTPPPLGLRDLRMEKSVAQSDVAPLCLHSFIFATLVNCSVRIQARGTTCPLMMKKQRKQQNKHPHKRSLREMRL